MFRKLRVLAAFFMVPLVVFSNPQSAAAANSELVVISFGGTSTGPVAGYLQTNCHFGMAISSDGLVTVGSDAYCYGGADITPGFCGEFEAGCSLFTFEVRDVSGEVCGSFVFQDPASGPKDSLTNIHTLLGGGSVSIGYCDPVSVCLLVDVDATAAGDSHLAECASSGLDGVPEDISAEGCTYTNMQPIVAPVITQKAVIPDGTNYRVRVKIEGDIPGPLATDAASVTWRLYALGYHLQGNDTIVRVGGTEEFFTGPFAVGAGTLGHYAFVSDSNLFTSVEEAELFLLDLEVTGFGMFLDMPGDNPGNNLAVPLPNGANPNGKVGINNPARCSYYFGEKIADYGTVSPYDEPTAPLVEQPDDGGVPPVPPDTTNPEDEPVPEDEPGFWGAILAALKSIWGAIVSVGNLIKGLAGKIVDGITAAFEGLFVPDDGYLESRYTSIESKWADTSPAKYADAVSDFSVGSASGCEGMPLVLTLPGDVQVDQHIGAACSGPLASTASIVRTVLSAVFVIGGLFACVRAVGSGLGWDPGVGRGAGA